MTQSLMTKIYDWKNLLNAWEKVEENEGCAGIDGITIDKFDLDLSNNLTSIQNELMNQSYKPDPLLRFYVEKDNAEKRPLSVPTVRDRVAQTAVTLILNPIFEQEFEDISFAYRLNKSRHNAISKITEWRDKGYVWVIDADIKSYFDEVNHDILIKRVRELVSDEYVIQLIVLWITSPIYDKDGVILPPKGLPQGAVISPLLANLYLDRFDEAMEKSRYKLVRYADDFLVLCESKHLAEQALEIVRNILSDLGLMLNKEKTKIVSFDDGFEYLGAIFARSLVTIPEPEYGKVKPPITGISEAKKLYSTTKGTPLGKALIDSFRESNLQAMDCNIEPKETPINTELDVEASSLAFMRTLYIQSQGSILRRQNERFVVSKDEEVISEVHIMKVEQIIIFGNCAITTPAMTTCLQENIPITFLSSNGKYYGRLESTNNTNIVLQQLQFERANDENFCLKISKGFVKGKLNNMRIFLQRRNREITSEAIQKAIDSISADIKNSEDTLAIDQLRGYEGTASARYFDVFDLMLKDTLGFEKRIRQPPTDPINSLLSFGYTLLFYNIYSLLTIHGLNPYCGFFHSIRQGHPALASDMIEEFRSIVIDSLVVYLVNSGILKESDFIYPQDPDKPCLLSNSARKEFIGRFEQKMHTEITHPQTGFHTNYRRCIELQVKELIRCIKWEKEEYVPMIISH